MTELSIRLFLFFFMLFLSSAVPAKAQHPDVQPVTADEDTVMLPLGLYLEYLEDTSGNLTIKEASSEKFSEKFVPSKRETLNFGYTRSAYWIKFNLSYLPKYQRIEKELLLELRYPLIDHVELWFPGPDGTWTVRKTGDHLSFSHRDVEYHNFVFRIMAVPNMEQTFYLRLQSEGTIEIPIVLWSPVKFAEAVNKRQYISGIYYGLMWAMAVYNLFIFMSVRDISYFFHVLYIVSYIFFQVSLSGEGYEYLWPDFPWWSNHSIPFLITTTAVCISLFSKAFLHTKAYFPRLDKLISFFIAGSIPVMIMSLTAGYALSVRLATIWILLGMGIVVITGMISLAKGHRSARFFMIAWMTFLGGTIIYSMKTFGLLPANFFTSYTMQIGSAMLVMLLSLGLADRINLERKEKLLAQEKALNAHQEALKAQEAIAETLETEVEERTGELRATLEQVENANTQILESIRYAQKIQSSLLPSKEKMARCFKSYFIIDEPKHIVGGDIYLFEEFEDGYLLALMDCTGHGVPGALMTMLAGSSFKVIVKKYYYDNPARILKALNMAVKTSLYDEEGKESASDDGMDASVCFVDTGRQMLTFAGAKMSLYYTDAAGLHTVKGDKQSIGYKNANPAADFTNHHIAIQSETAFYMSTDGIADQAGGPKRLPFGNARFRTLLKDIRKEPFDGQRNKIIEAYMEWKGDEEQRDDVTVLGFAF
ncbi:MAG: hypothetical protein BWK80_27375 [Desulfobacteraceae bacterium IS3]|nr:MAG: hypothetical protein BWK80_27375 [Desulfobacteraceae bacterium IS3]